MAVWGGVSWARACKCIAAALFLQIIIHDGADAAGASARSGSAAGSDVESVYVTARRQSEKAQDVPISLTRVGAGTLDANGVTNVLGLGQFVPSLQVISFNPRNTALLIRGLGANIAITSDGVESGTAVYVDGVLYARPGQSLFDLPDLASVEELRGPQGTLYGKNAVAGVININTLKPNATAALEATASGGNYGARRLTVTATGPLDSSDHLLGRLALYDSDRSGFFKNVHNGLDEDDAHSYGARGQILFEPIGNLSLSLIADYARFRARAPIRPITTVTTTLANGQPLPNNFFERSAAAGYTPLPIDPFARVTDINSPVRSNMEDGGLAAHVDWTVNGYTLTSITAWRYWNWRPQNDNDLTALSVLTQAQQANNERQFSQELRLASPIGNPIRFSGGLYYFWERDDGFAASRLGSDAPLWLLGSAAPLYRATLDGFGFTATSLPLIHSYAAYGQLSWQATSRLELSAGFRYTHEDKSGSYDQATSGASLMGFSAAEQAAAIGVRAAFAGPMSYSVHTSNDLVGGLLSATYRIDARTNAYASYSHGEKSAGLNLANIPATVPKIIAPEAIDDYEIGLKLSRWSGRLTLSADLFWEEDTNYQTTLVDTTKFISYLSNIPAVRSRGFEFGYASSSRGRLLRLHVRGLHRRHL